MGADVRVVAEKHGVPFTAIQQRSYRQGWLVPSRVAQMAQAQRQMKREMSEARKTKWFGGAAETEETDRWGELSTNPIDNGGNRHTGLSTNPIDNEGNPHTGLNRETMEYGVKGAGDDEYDMALLLKRAKEQEARDAIATTSALVQSWELRGEVTREIAYQIGLKSLKNVVRSDGIMLTSAKDVRSMVTMMREATGVFRDDHVPGLSVFGGHHADDMENVIDVSGPVTETTMDVDGWW